MRCYSVKHIIESNCGLTTCFKFVKEVEIIHYCNNPPSRYPGVPASY